MEAPAVRTLAWSYLGLRPYREVWERQEGIRRAILASSGEPHLLLVQHPPVLTLGRAEKGANLLVDRDELRRRGFDVVETTRGGKVTYHGPGQLVAYPVVDLRTCRMGVKQFVAALEETMIRTLAAFGLRGGRKEACIGCWVEGRKIGSIGIHVRRQVSIHGLALNVRPDLSHFEVMNPCGLAGVRMTSLLAEGKDVPFERVIPAFVAAYGEVFETEMREAA
jgi:lipoate-protein ligase B